MFILNYVYKRPKQLFGTINAKTVKGEKVGIKTAIIYMSPDKQNITGGNLCPNSTAGCRASCLFTAGRGRFTNVKMGRLHKSEFFLREQDLFMQQMVMEITKFIKKYGNDYKIALRLNGTSDIPYENIPINGFENIMSMFPEIQFYEYTKTFSRLNDKLPLNYHLTFSYAETPDNQKESLEALKMGFNVAMVFDVKNETELPKTYLGFNVVNGDFNDVTFLHPKNTIIGLKAKGMAKKDVSGFVIRNF